MSHFTLPVGTVVHFHGIPFSLTHDTVLEGHPANIEMVQNEHPVAKEKKPNTKIEFAQLRIKKVKA